MSEYHDSVSWSKVGSVVSASWPEEATDNAGVWAAPASLPEPPVAPAETSAEPRADERNHAHFRAKRDWWEQQALAAPSADAAPKLPAHSKWPRSARPVRCAPASEPGCLTRPPQPRAQEQQATAPVRAKAPPVFYAMSAAASCPAPASPPGPPQPKAPPGPPPAHLLAGRSPPSEAPPSGGPRPPSEAPPDHIRWQQHQPSDYNDVIDDAIDVGECAFGDTGCEGGNPAYHGAPEQVWGGDGSAQLLSSIVSSAAHKVRNVMQGANDNELLALAGRVSNSLPGRSPPAQRAPPMRPHAEPEYLRSAPWKHDNGPSPGPPVGVKAPGPPPGPPPAQHVHWGGYGEEHDDDIDFASIASGSQMPAQQGTHPTHYQYQYGAMSEGGGAYITTGKGAPTVISMAAPPNKDGEVITRGGETLTLDSAGRLTNSLGQRCDIYGRLTKARGNKGRQSSQRHCRGYGGGSHRRDDEEAWEGSHWREDEKHDTEWPDTEWRDTKWHGADWHGAGESESDPDPWKHWHGCASSSGYEWSVPCEPSLPRP